MPAAAGGVSERGVMKAGGDRVPGAVLAEAVGCHQRGDLAGAARGYRAVLSALPGQFEALLYLGLLEAQRGNVAEGAQWLRQAAAVQPGSEAAQLNLANALFELGQLEEALAATGAALKANARSALTLNSRGLILLELKRPGEALECFEIGRAHV